MTGESILLQIPVPVPLFACPLQHIFVSMRFKIGKLIEQISCMSHSQPISPVIFSCKRPLHPNTPHPFHFSCIRVKEPHDSPDKRNLELVKQILEPLGEHIASETDDDKATIAETLVNVSANRRRALGQVDTDRCKLIGRCACAYDNRRRHLRYIYPMTRLIGLFCHQGRETALSKRESK